MEALTKIENSIVSLMYKGVDDDVITDKLNLGDGNFNIYRSSIFKKLKVTNWINAFSLVFDDNNEGNLNKKELADNYIIKSTNNIRRLKKLKTLSRNERKMSLFDELLNLYSSLEFKYPLKYFKE